MKRVQLFEFEDFSWFPSWLRTCMTNLIVILQKMMGIDKVLATLIADVLQKTSAKKIVDLGSGSGGVMPLAIESLHRIAGFEDIVLLMTDLYPNEELVKKFNTDGNDKIRYNEMAVDATNIASAPGGLKTMVNSFHHMRPVDAKRILLSAQENAQPLLIYEMAENKIPILIWWLLLPLSLIIVMLMVLCMTPFVRPMTWQQLVFTYLIPIIPICYAWDGQASLPRMYALKDIEELLPDLRDENYVWEYDQATKANGKKLGTYIVGFPKS